MRPAARRCQVLICGLLLCGGWLAGGADLEEAQELFRSGRYARSLGMAEEILKEPQNITNRKEREDWQLLLNQSLLTLGRYPEALQSITNLVAQDRRSIRLRWQAREALRSNGATEAADALIEEIIRLVSGYPGYYRDAPNLVVFGRAALLGGVDPKRVLDTLFDAARKDDPTYRQVYLASGQLALEKHDFALAAKRFEEGLKQHPKDPDLHYGLARAYAPNLQTLMIASLEAALESNSNHIDSLLLLADHQIDAEDYAEAEKLLDRIKAVNPWHPEAWAYRAVLAHLRNQPQAEQAARRTALRFWPTNPQVDHIIGRKLSQNYRFAEGAACQRRALEYAPDFLPAKSQLAQDLLRLGEEAEGWRLAAEVQKQDGYDVGAYNLVTLHQTMGKFTTLTNQHFIVRMNSHEAALYGPRVLDLLNRARERLGKKYDFTLEQPAIIEIFSEQKDFDVRTFGMPGNPGYLGVCFGRVITANSPAAHAGAPVNWEAVLWHEFCHVVTLQMTRNKMPRWLSEGISVYEELQANPAWGQRMTPRYREMILEGELTPVSKLSGAFLAPPSGLHLQFAYYQCSMVVDFLVRGYGLEALKNILRDLGQGMEINAAIEKHTTPMAVLEKDFAAFARRQAEQLAPGLNWEKPEFAKTPSGRSPSSRPSGLRLPLSRALAPEDEEAAWNSWAKKHPTNFWVMIRQARQLIEEKKWAEAKPLLEKLVELYPTSVGPESAYPFLAAAHRALGETNAEFKTLSQFARQDDEAVDAYLRLMELGAAAEDWAVVLENARRFLAVNPLVASPYKFLAQASEALDQSQTAIDAYRALLRLDPPDPAETHFRLAKHLHQTGHQEARRHLLQALEEAPRYREALRLLLKMNREQPLDGGNDEHAARAEQTP